MNCSMRFIIQPYVTEYVQFPSGERKPIPSTIVQPRNNPYLLPVHRR